MFKAYKDLIRHSKFCNRFKIERRILIVTIMTMCSHLLRKISLRMNRKKQRLNLSLNGKLRRHTRKGVRKLVVLVL
jgi:hypothetical protein